MQNHQMNAPQLIPLLLIFTILSSPAEPLLLTRIHFGSCIKQGQPMPILRTILAEEPELFLFLGDNIYADTDNMAVMRAKYAQLNQNPDFAMLRATCPLLAVWDDHDFGKNDAGTEYPHKAEAQRVFLDFWGEAPDSPRRTREGIYDSLTVGPEGNRVQLILLDCRYFRGPLKTGERRIGGKYYPDDNPEITMLGDAQWKWLEGELREPAELRIIATGIQFIAEAAGQETWSNLPVERQRMIDLIAKTKANGVVFVSGDRHWADLSMQSEDVPYPLYDLTSSAINQIHPRGTPTENRFRAIAPPETTYHLPNYGLIEIDWETATVNLEVRDENGERRISQSVALKDLRAGE